MKRAGTPRYYCGCLSRAQTCCNANAAQGTQRSTWHAGAATWTFSLRCCAVACVSSVLMASSLSTWPPSRQPLRRLVLRVTRAPPSPFYTFLLSAFVGVPTATFEAHAPAVGAARYSCAPLPFLQGPFYCLPLINGVPTASFEATAPAVGAARYSCAPSPSC